MNNIFTDDEYDILSSALRKELRTCKEHDGDSLPPGCKELTPIVISAMGKLQKLQYCTGFNILQNSTCTDQNVDLEEHFLVATEPMRDEKNRFWRCPSCKRRIHEYHGYCKHCGKKVDWQPLMKKRKKEAEIRGRKEDRKKARTGA